jgi:glycosyltransferase involved in cell wall biosynthesis
MTIPNILTLVNQMGGCELWRALIPITELQRQGYTGIQWGFRNDGRLAHIVHHYDAIVLQRLNWLLGDEVHENGFISAFHKAGIAVIYETDDDIFTDHWIRFNMDTYGYSEEESSEMAKARIRTLQKCDGVTVSTQRVATIVRNYTDKPVKVVGNYIDLHRWKTVQKRSRRDPRLTGITIGWAGGRRPDTDIESMAIAWGRIAAKYPKVMFVVQGHHAQVIYDNVPNDRIVMIKWLPIESYPSGFVNIDIGCCPLDDNRFNRSKTFIKAMEYAASSAAVVASPTVYAPLIEHGKDGYLATTADEWEQYLSMLVEDYTLRHDMAKQLLAKVRKYYSIETNAVKWLDAWADIVSNYKEHRRSPHILIPAGVDYYARTQ